MAVSLLSPGGDEDGAPSDVILAAAGVPVWLTGLRVEDCLHSWNRMRVFERAAKSAHPGRRPARGRAERQAIRRRSAADGTDGGERPGADEPAVDETAALTGAVETYFHSSLKFCRGRADTGSIGGFTMLIPSLSQATFSDLSATAVSPQSIPSNAGHGFPTKRMDPLTGRALECLVHAMEYLRER